LNHKFKILINIDKIIDKTKEKVTKNNKDIVPLELSLNNSPTIGKLYILLGSVSIVKKGIRAATEIISAKAFAKFKINKK
tara:strand:+ start:447 stop:686 length:240 start_codon:yes stop_codon:yes gene_type:complete